MPHAEQFSVFGWPVRWGKLSQSSARESTGFGFYESRMAGPGAFWCNAPQCENTDACRKRFVIMGFSYERGVGEMLEDLRHRAESELQYRRRSTPDRANL